MKAQTVPDTRGLVPGIHVLKQEQSQRRGWPGHPRDEVPGGGHDAVDKSARIVGITGDGDKPLGVFTRDQ
jgi:hypothetical protein